MRVARAVACRLGRVVGSQAPGFGDRVRPAFVVRAVIRRPRCVGVSLRPRRQSGRSSSVINLLQINSAGGTSSRLPLITCRSSSARGSHLFGTHPSTHVPGCDRRSQHTPKGTRGPSETPRTPTRRPTPLTHTPPRRPDAPSFRKKCGPRPLMRPSPLTSPSHPIPQQ